MPTTSFIRHPWGFARTVYAVSETGVTLASVKGVAWCHSVGVVQDLFPAGFRCYAYDLKHDSRQRRVRFSFRFHECACH